MCGIVGIVGNQNVVGQLYDGLIVFQYCGQDVVGIVIVDGICLCVQKVNGLVCDVFDVKWMLILEGCVGIVYVCYLIVGLEGMDEVQLFYVNLLYGIVLVYNGNLINIEVLCQQVFEQDCCNVNIDLDSEVLLNVFVYELDVQCQFILEVVICVVVGVYCCCKGGYVVISVVLGLGLVVFCDLYGICLLVLGKCVYVEGDEYIVVFELFVLDVLGFQCVCDVCLGEVLVIIVCGELFFEVCVELVEYSLCIFEYVYFVCLDLMIDNVLVYKVCMCMGIKLGEKILCLCLDYDIDIIILILDILCDVVLEIFNMFGVKYCEGFIKNCYIGCIFIMLGQGEWVKLVCCKFNLIYLEFCNCVVLLVDDLIVCGIISQQIVQMVCDVGVCKVYLVSVVLLVCYFNIYGIDMLVVEELVVYNWSVEEIEVYLGCDWLIYQDIEDMEVVVCEGNLELKMFDFLCFNGIYLIGIELGYFECIQQLCLDDVKYKWCV